MRRLEQPLDERVDGVGAGEDDPVERAGPLARLVERAEIVGRRDPNHRRLDRLCAHRLQSFDQLGGLIARPRHENPLAEERSGVEPAQVLAERHDAADDENRRTPIGRVFGDARELVERSDERFLRRQRAVVHECRRLVRRAAVRDERAQDARELLRADVADDGAVQFREVRPVDRRARLPFVFVPAHERERVAAAGVRDRDARVARHADPGRDAGDHLEPHALLVQEQRFRSAAVEYKRIAPLQARDRLAFARFFGEQVTDRFLLERLRRGDPDVDLLRVRPRVAQQSRMHQMVVQHDICLREALHPSGGDEARIARARANQVHDAHDVNREPSTGRHIGRPLQLSTLVSRSQG